MKLVVLALLFIGACATATPGTPATPVSIFDACSDAALETAAKGILGAVTTALASDDPEGALAVLVGQTSEAEVLCAVQLVVAELQTKAAADKLASIELAAGQAYLAKHSPVTK